MAAVQTMVKQGIALDIVTPSGWGLWRDESGQGRPGSLGSVSNKSLVLVFCWV